MYDMGLLLLGQSASGLDCSFSHTVLTAMVADQQLSNAVLLLAHSQFFDPNAFGVDQRHRLFPVGVIFILIYAPDIMEQAKVDQDLLIRITQGIASVMAVDKGKSSTRRICFSPWWWKMLSSW